MDTLTLAAFLTGGSVVASLLVGFFKSVLKEVSDRWGALATQLLLLAICVLVAAVLWAFQFLPINFVAAVSMIFAGAITLYEVAYKAFLQQAVKGQV